MLATKSEQWNGKPWLTCNKCLTPTFEDSCGCIVLNMPELGEMTKQIEWGAKQNQPSQSGLHFGRSDGVEELKRLPGTQSKGYFTIDHLEERGVER